MTTLTHSLKIRTGEFISAVPMLYSFAIASFLSFVVCEVTKGASINIGSIYSGIFDLLSIFTGFLATFYVFIVTKSNKFLQSISGTRTFKMMLVLLKVTIFWSCLMIVFSYVMMVIEPKSFDAFSFKHFLVFFWLWNTALIFVNFWRCVRQFIMIVETNR